VGLIDGIDMTVKPIVHRLAAGANQRARENEAQENQHPVVRQALTGGDRSTRKSPDRRKPGNRLEKLSDGAKTGVSQCWLECKAGVVHALIM
jgi:hypothetical protein